MRRYNIPSESTDWFADEIKDNNADSEWPRARYELDQALDKFRRACHTIDPWLGDIDDNMSITAKAKRLLSDAAEHGISTDEIVEALKTDPDTQVQIDVVNKPTTVIQKQKGGDGSKQVQILCRSSAHAKEIHIQQNVVQHESLWDKIKRFFIGKTPQGDYKKL